MWGESIATTVLPSFLETPFLSAYLDPILTTYFESLKRNSALLFGLEGMRDEELLSVVRGGYRRLVHET
ncbi:hypothetical protein Sjap_008019 [Stephania japonica]|uniref:Uncharacterized protein n=1 Tax=Stephania japonica TaxID=461633 RepID=A0AAP0PE74_9MAGN